MTTRPFSEPPEPASDAVPGAFDPVAEGKRLLRSIRSGALATLDPEGAPFASLVNVATAPDGSPILLLSQLAGHTRHLLAQARCSLLLAESGKGDPLTHPRLTLVGAALRDAGPGLRARFLRRHPKAALYAGFADFAIWRFGIVRAHLNGGFARAATLEPDDILTSLEGAEDLIEAEAGALDHLNADHADALALMARHFAGQTEGAWRATGIDPDGLDLGLGVRTARVAFPARVTESGNLRRTLVAMTTQARAAV
jgi:putative heme iron utilization protein